MYIVSQGKLKVMSDNGRNILATLKAGSYFGEIAVLNMGSVGNRRTASVISVGYSELYRLTKRDIWEVLEDYPTARQRLELIANRRLQQKLEQAKRESEQEGKLNCKGGKSDLISNFAFLYPILHFCNFAFNFAFLQKFFHRIRKFKTFSSIRSHGSSRLHTPKHFTLQSTYLNQTEKV